MSSILNTLKRNGTESAAAESVLWPQNEEIVIAMRGGTRGLSATLLPVRRIRCQEGRQFIGITEHKLAIPETVRYLLVCINTLRKSA